MIKNYTRAEMLIHKVKSIDPENEKVKIIADAIEKAFAS